MNSKGLIYLNSFPTNEQYDAKTCSCRQLVLQEDWQDHQIVCSERRFICPAYLAFLNRQRELQEYYERSLIVVDSNCPISLKELAKLRVLENVNGKLDSILSKETELPFSIIHTLSYECPTFDNLNSLSEHVTCSCPYWKVNCLPRFLIRSEDLFCRDWHWQIHDFINAPGVDSGLSRWNFLEVHSKAVSLDPISHKLKPIPFLYPSYCSFCDHYFPENTTKHLCARCKNPLKNPRKPGTYQQLENNCTLCINKNQIVPPSDSFDSIVLCQACKNPLMQPYVSDGSRQVGNNCINCDLGSVIVFLPGLGSYFPPSSRQNSLYRDCLSNWQEIKSKLMNKEECS
ncbi:10750_t:CDS:2 [Ambispora leptoticha]|uniref:10750_t:CDS:1 n=1 Tax=Ambispora leptoticha TaxID=144679 RepID=A0A9N8YWW3_9GLOM|nr:10750_t:CDS:2 [Ambispora leptoticha]